MKNIVILGASGFVGYEIIQMCLMHSDINIIALSANRAAGESPNLDKMQDNQKVSLKYQKLDEINFNDVDYIFNCLPNKSLYKITDLFSNRVRLIDLSADFRLDKPDDYLTWYGFQHDNLNLIDEFQYGLTEIYRDKIKVSKHIANPGCYATSVLMPLIELVKNDLIDADSIIVDSKSGYSGAGKTNDPQSLMLEVKETIKTYGVGDHKHIAEINQEISRNINNKTEIFFSANLIPVERGILSNIYVELKNSSHKEVHETLSMRFKNEPFIEIMPLDTFPSTKDVIGTNNLVIGVKKGYKDNRICIVSALDNLIKGAAGQAIQNFNVMNEFEETKGIINE